MRKISPQVIEESINKHPLSMAAAARECGLPFSTFRRKALALGRYVPNQGGKGRIFPRRGATQRIDVRDIIEGRVKYVNTDKLKKKLYKARIKIPECEKCGQGDVWNGEPLVMHLDHMDGDKTNALLENLQILCPNCHAQTPTYCGKNKVLKMRAQK